MPASRIQYLSVTFKEDVVFGAGVVAAGTTMSLQKDIARGLYKSVVINGPGSADSALYLNAIGGGAPVTVSGTPAVGNTLTAVLAAGWSVGGYQWLRDGVPISGATTASFLLTTADPTHVITLNVSGLVYTPTGLTVTGGIVLVAWDDTVVWDDTSTWTD